MTKGSKEPKSTREDGRPGQAESVVEVEFTLHDSKYPFVGASESEACRVELADMVPRPDGRYAEFFNVVGVAPDRIAGLGADYDTVEVSVLRESERGGLLEFLVSGDCPAFSLAERGALPREVVGVDGAGRIVAEIPPQHDSAAVVGTFLKENPDAELAAKREVDGVTPMFTRSAAPQLLETHLTDRQREVLQAAFEAGYYEWPRESTGKEVAEALGITSATFSEHIHAAERNLLTALLDGVR